MMSRIGFMRSRIACGRSRIGNRMSGIGCCWSRIGNKMTRIGCIVSVMGRRRSRTSCSIDRTRYQSRRIGCHRRMKGNRIGSTGRAAFGQMTTGRYGVFHLFKLHSTGIFNSFWDAGICVFW
jgi:hypothetical protein